MDITINKKITEEITDQKNELIDYYVNAGPDYAFWSKKFNMHFGYYKKGMNPLRLEPMLDKMSEIVLENLDLPTNLSQHIVDMGCGLGTTARHIQSIQPNIDITGVSIVPWQIQEATRLTQLNKQENHINFIKADYRAISVESNIADGAYALESACHCPGKSKKAFIQEMTRILQPGKNFVIIDGFLKKDENQFPTYAKWIYNRMCKGWAVPEMANINDFTQELKNAGLINIKIQNLFWNVAPSALYIPKTLFKFIFSLLRTNKPITKEQWNNAEASFMGFLLGMHYKLFGYYKITGTKPE